MRTLFIVLMIAGLMSTVGVYAAGLGGAPTIKTVGGTGVITVNAPTSGATTVTLNWLMTGSQVTGVDVVWTPDLAKTYDIGVTAGGVFTNAYTSPTATADTIQTDTLTFATAVEADDIADAKTTILEN